jgi:hypothetical protein
MKLPENIATAFLDPEVQEFFKANANAPEGATYKYTPSLRKALGKLLEEIEKTSAYYTSVRDKLGNKLDRLDEQLMDNEPMTAQSYMEVTGGIVKHIAEQFKSLDERITKLEGNK